MAEGKQDFFLTQICLSKVFAQFFFCLFEAEAVILHFFSPVLELQTPLGRRGGVVGWWWIKNIAEISKTIKKPCFPTSWSLCLRKSYPGHLATVILSSIEWGTDKISRKSPEVFSRCTCWLCWCWYNKSSQEKAKTIIRQIFFITFLLVQQS